uniref:Uncharacterized protein n=1 Tax=Vespula pensylvanica TaxID=30213 RepID=A0A834P9R2_VESPE|nr:hypothetical protein H0235_002391 [Vespula pensylvanica]
MKESHEDGTGMTGKEITPCRKVAQKKRSRRGRSFRSPSKQRRGTPWIVPREEGSLEKKVNNFNVIHPLSPLAKLPEHSVPSLALPLLFSSMEASISRMLVTIGSTVSTRKCSNSSGTSNSNSRSSSSVVVVGVVVGVSSSSTSVVIVIVVDSKGMAIVVGSSRLGVVRLAWYPLTVETHTRVDWIGHCTPTAQLLNRETASGRHYHRIGYGTNATNHLHLGKRLLTVLHNSRQVIAHRREEETIRCGVYRDKEII